MSTPLKKDELYYSDLAYVFKKYAGILEKRDSLVEKRIADRCHSTSRIENGVVGEVFSEFQLEVFSTIEGVLALTRGNSKPFALPTNYQEIVNNTLSEIESKREYVKKKNN